MGPPSANQKVTPKKKFKSKNVIQKRKSIYADFS